MFIELHDGKGEPFLFNTKNIEVVVPDSNVDGCNASVFLSHSDYGLAVRETYDEIKALLAGQVVAAAKGTDEESPDKMMEDCVAMLAKLGRTP